MVLCFFFWYFGQIEYNIIRDKSKMPKVETIINCLCIPTSLCPAYIRLDISLLLFITSGVRHTREHPCFPYFKLVINNFKMIITQPFLLPSNHKYDGSLLYHVSNRGCWRWFMMWTERTKSGFHTISLKFFCGQPGESLSGVSVTDLRKEKLC